MVTVGAVTSRTGAGMSVQGMCKSCARDEAASVVPCVVDYGNYESNAASCFSCSAIAADSRTSWLGLTKTAPLKFHYLVACILTYEPTMSCTDFARF